MCPYDTDRVPGRLSVIASDVTSAWTKLEKVFPLKVCTDHFSLILVVSGRQQNHGLRGQSTITCILTLTLTLTITVDV